MKSRIKDFTEGRIPTQLIVFSAPLFLSNLMQVIYNMADMFIVGQVHGKVGISAVSVGGDLCNLLTFIAIGFSNAGQVLVAKYIGAGQKDKLGRFMGTMCTFLLSGALVISVISIIFQDALLKFMQTPDSAYTDAAEYSLICMIGLVFIYGYNMVSAVLRGMGDSKHPFIFVSLAAVMNIVLDIVFVVYADFGAKGAALATVISQGTSFLMCAGFLFIKRREFELSVTLRDFLVPEKEMLVSLVKLGIPMAIKMASVQISKLFVNSQINAYGVEVSAFSGIANKISSISNLISAAMNTAGSTMVGQNIAAGKEERVKKILKTLAAITLSVSTLISCIFLFFQNEIIGFFADGDESVVAVGEHFFLIAVLLFYASAMRAIMNALLNGSGNTKVNFATAIFDGIIMRFGLAILFGMVLNMEYYGFWLGDALAGFTPFVIGVVFYVTGSWKKNMPTQAIQKV
ncbi:MAG: MATE family efflux transporter [Clostridia bacterium]|nr:MATE family efflux transporter [Clostridia bacterium]